MTDGILFRVPRYKGVCCLGSPLKVSGTGYFKQRRGVADLPLSMQVELLRAVQEKAVRRIGDTRETFVDVRIVCTTHKNLDGTLRL